MDSSISLRQCSSGRAKNGAPLNLTCVRLGYASSDRYSPWKCLSAVDKAYVSVFLKKGTITGMNNTSIADILELPVQERIRLVELIWDSIAAVPEAVEVSPALKAELEARLVEFEANPEAGYSWDQVKLRLKDGSWRTA